MSQINSEYGQTHIQTHTGANVGYPMSSKEESSGAWAGYLALAMVIIAIILLIILYVYYRGSATNLFEPKWNIKTGASSGNTDTFLASAGEYYTVSTSSSALALTLTAPPNASGQQFIIDNSKSGTTVNLVGRSTSNILPKTLVTYIWLSDSTISPISKLS